jgi:single-strand selective monofunctional uracil DNA glycosylase
MNPGPWGMAQTGVPFGDVTMVRDWMGIEATVDKPAVENPKRPVLGFACTRNEVSGTRLWGWARDTFGTPERFFETFFVANYCPLSFMEASGRNVTPDKLPAAERKPLIDHCDTALQQLVAHLQPDFAIGVGAFAEKQIRRALPEYQGVVGRILHPSPASPKANRGWSAVAEAELRELGVRW